MKAIIFTVTCITGKEYIKISQRKRCIGQRLREYQTWSFPCFQDVVPSQHWWVTLSREYCHLRTHLSFCVQNGIEASLHGHHWLIDCCPHGWTQFLGPLISSGVKALAINHKVGLSGVASPCPKTWRCDQLKEEGKEEEEEEEGWEEKEK